MNIGNKKGFTLIELIVVIAIIGVLAGIAAPSIFSYVTASQQKADQVTANNIKNAVNAILYTDNTNRYKDNVKGGIFWTNDQKTELRARIGEKLGMGKVKIESTNNEIEKNLGGAEDEWSLIPRPKENSHAFYMYLLPPYTVMSLKCKNTSTGIELYKSGDLDTAFFTSDATYTASKFADYGQYKGGVTLETVKDLVTLGGAATIAAVSSASDGENHIGWLNRGIDYGIKDADYTKDTVTGS